MFSPPRSALLALAALPALAAHAAATQGATPAKFRVLVLDTLSGSAGGLREEARAINAQGELVGTVVGNGRSLAAHWSKKGDLTLLAVGQAGASSFAHDLNDGGVAIGRIVGGPAPEAFQWTASTGKVPLALGEAAVPLAINASQTIAFSLPSPEAAVVGATWSGSQGTTPIGGPQADVLVRDLNTAGAVTGILGGGETAARAFRWTAAGGLVELATPPGFDHAQGNGINDLDVVVGASLSAARDQATVWSAAGQASVLPSARPGDKFSSAQSVNASGWIVGLEYADPKFPDETLGVLWVEGRPYALDDLLTLPPKGPDVHVTAALDVNAKGQIAARGIVDGVERALRLDP